MTHLECCVVIHTAQFEISFPIMSVLEFSITPSGSVVLR